MTQEDEPKNLPQLSLQRITFSRYVGEIGNTVVDSYEPGAQNFGEEREGESDTVFPEIGTPRFQKTGLVKQRLFDANIRTAGKDTRVLIREISGEDSEDGERECGALVEREIKALSALSKVAEDRTPVELKNARLWESSNLFEGKAPFTQLVGELTAPMQMMREISPKQAEAWVGTLGTEPPRPKARWLVYEYDGVSTAATFSVPTRLRYARALQAQGGSMGLATPAAARKVSWDQSAKFAVDGIIRQTLEALAFVHDAGYAHRSLSPESIVLSDKGDPINKCDPSLLVLKLQNFGFASLLGDDSPERKESAERWKLDPESSLDRTALSVAEDLHSAGLVFLSVLLRELAEPEAGANPAVPMRSIEEFERQIENIYKGDVSGQFREYVAAEPAWERASAFIDKNLGWDFLELLLRARETAASASAGFSFLTARSMLNHPFLK